MKNPKNFFFNHFDYRIRILILAVAVFLGFLLIFLRGIFLQIFEHEELSKMAETKNYLRRNIVIHRGEILDRDGQVLAASLPSPSVYFLKKYAPDLSTTARKVASVLRLNPKKLEKKLESASNFAWVKSNISEEEEGKINVAKIPGIFLAPDFVRYYPEMHQASQIIGFTGKYSKGREGIEYKYDDLLMGRKQKKEENFFEFGYKKDLRITQGSNIFLTIDEEIQYYTEKTLKNAVTEMDAINGVAIVMDTHNGEILAMASVPDYDPNRYQNFEQKKFYNRAIGDTYEPGSIFKVITISIARQNGFIDKKDEFYAENGYYQVLDYTIRDSTGKFGILSIGEIIEKSSNIGAIKIAQKIPRKIFYEKILEYGFNKKTDVGMPGEEPGVVHGYETWSDSDLATISYGLSISVTPIQMISAINAIANFGLYVKPQIIKSFTNDKNEVIFKSQIETRRILDKSIAKEMIGYMERVVGKEGTGKLANLKNIKVAGKTGTTRKYNKRYRQYSTEDHIVSFGGFLPAENPQLTILVILNAPKKRKEGSKSAAPVFREIAKKAIDIHNRDNVPTSVVFEKSPKEPQNLFTASSFSKKVFKNQTDAKGLFLREVLLWATLNEKKLKIRGSGKVAKQKKDAQNSVLKLELN